MKSGGSIVFVVCALGLASIVEAVPADEPLLARALAGPMAGVDEIVFAVRQPGKDGHWYANFGYYAPDDRRTTYGDGGRLCRLNLRTGKLTVLVDDPRGGVRDPQVHYDGRKILFSYRKGGEKSYHLCEINVDGTGLRQLTDGPFDDIEPTYLPDGDIVFCSSRCKRWVNCWLTEVAILHRCDGDGKNIRPISSNNEHDNTPCVLPDGRILYTRWEYVDRSQVEFHHLWVVHPDGTRQMTYFGNMYSWIAMLDAKPIPGTSKVVASFSPGHGRREHAGAVTVVDPGAGPDERSFARRVSEKDDCRDPYPFSEDCFLVARGRSVLLMDGKGATQVLYSLPRDGSGLACHEPRPLRPRPRERLIPVAANTNEPTGRLVLVDTNYGRNMGGVRPGEIKKLLILESLPKPINFTGGMEPLSYGGTFTLERVLGTIPVEPDGSAHAQVPALRSLIFVALDENELAVKRMQSFVTVQPGETTSCAGCHEQRGRTPPATASPCVAALQRPASRIEPIADVPDVYDFPRDIQPVLDEHCIKCHDYDSREGGVILTGDRGPVYSHSYYTLVVRNQIADGRNAQGNRPPSTLGSSASPLMKLLDGSHHDATISPRQRKMIRLWIETGAPYPGTYAALGCGMIGGYAQNGLDRSDTKWPSMIAAQKALKRRCGECHVGAKRLADSPSDDLGKPPWIPLTPDDPRRRYSRHLLYNLTRPPMSLVLLAPLAREAGGYGTCRVDGKPIFADTGDAGYRKVLTAIDEVRKKLNEIKRFDMPGFRPRPAYVREMKRYGVLPATTEANDPIDVYATDRAYWQSLWYDQAASASEETAAD